MKKIDISIDLSKLNLSPQEKDFFAQTGFKGILENLVTQGLTSKYRDGLTNSKQRILNRLLNKLDSIGQDNILEIEGAEFDLLKEVFLSEDVKFQPTQSRLVVQYINKIEYFLGEKQKAET